MKTFMKIPFERAKEDPSWLTKKHAGLKLDPIEIEEYYRYKFEKNH
jgi:hypothetical protein